VTKFAYFAVYFRKFPGRIGVFATIEMGVQMTHEGGVALQYYSSGSKLIIVRLLEAA